MPLFLLRHPPTPANRWGLVLGASDPPADPEGLAAFEAMTRQLAGKGVARVFSSPLVRAAVPARLLADRLGVPFDVLPGLAELSAGSFEGRPRSEVVPDGRLLRASWNDRPPGGESMADAEPRVAAAMTEVQDALGRGSAALVGHAVVNRLILKFLTKQPEAALLDFVHPHGNILAIDQDGRMTWLNADGPILSGPGEPGAAP